MSNLVRLESMTIEGIKNVENGELLFDELSKIKNNMYLSQLKRYLQKMYFFLQR